MKQLVIFPKGSLTPKERERISKAGYLAIEADDPSKVVVAVPGCLVNETDLFRAALKTIANHQDFGNEVRSRFVQELWRTMQPATPQGKDASK
jgi:hypothetical protein